jgi:sortase A
MVWAQSVLEEDMQEDLKHGAIHYPRTAPPGQPGNMFIAAHSSNYAWVEGNFNAIFSKMNDVAPGDIVKITQLLSNGAKLEYLYKVTQNRIVQPDDPWIFMPTAKPTLTLSTCWPLGTRQKRMIVKATLL